MSKDLNANLRSELRAGPWVWKTALCLGRNMCWGLNSALPRRREFLLWMSNVFVSGSVSRGSAGVWLRRELLFHGRAWGALARQETAATACLSQGGSQGQLPTGICSQAVGIDKFPFSDDGIHNGHFGIIPAAALGTSQWLGIWMRQGRTFVVLWNRDLYRCGFLLFQKSVGYLLGLLLNNLSSKLRSLLNYSK